MVAEHRVTSAPKARASKREARARTPSPDDSVLDTDSEEDEFADQFGIASNDEDSDSNEEAKSLRYTQGNDDDGGIPGLSVWKPDEWDGGSEDDYEGEKGDDEDAIGQAKLRLLQNNLTSLPFSALMRAQRSLRERSPSKSASDASSEAGPSSFTDERVSKVKAKLAEMQKRKGKAADVKDEDGRDMREVEEKESQAAEKLRRDSKHAPTAISSKKQVTRMRRVVDVPKPERRDPRFSSVSAGQINPHLHDQSYGFLPKMLRSELLSLKTAVSSAAKAERTCTWTEKPARTAERERLEGERGRLRTRIERTERETADREVLAGMKRQEREKQKQGKGQWFMKKGEKRDLLLKSRFDALQEKGGKTAVKKAIEKKRKKVASKEKKSRPFAKGESERLRA